MKERFTIGQMAKLHNMNVKTLRYYDEIGLFPPFEVDERNGYRYYSVDQFKDLDFILYLKEIGLSLDEIKEQLTNRTIDSFVSTLKHYERVNREKIERALHIQEMIEQRLVEFQQLTERVTVDQPFCETYDDRYFIQNEQPIQSYEQLERSLRELVQENDHFLSVVIGKVGLTVDEVVSKGRALLAYDSIFIFINAHSLQWKTYDRVKRLSGGTYASIYFRGGHEQTIRPYEQLQRYVAEKGLTVDSPYVMRVLIDRFVTDEPNDYLSILQVKVKDPTE